MPAPRPAHSALLAPALTRRLDHAAKVKRLGHRLAAGLAGVSCVAALGTGIPAYAGSIAEAEPQPVAAAAVQVQSFSHETDAATQVIQRDNYTVIVPPRLQYPLLTGTGITSGFGPRGGRMHEGADLFPGYGTPIHAIAAGVVLTASGAGAYGNHVILQHTIDGQKVTSIYAHMAPGTMSVRAGQSVAVGQVIGAVGETGNAQGAHLHFEIRPGGGAAVDPYPWIAARLQ